MEGNAMEMAAMGAAAGYDFSMWGLFVKADLVVKGVMVLLVFASVWCWAIIVEKILRLRRLNKMAGQFEDKFWSGGSLDDLYDRVGSQPQDPMTAVFAAAMREWRRAASKNGARVGASRENLQDRIDRVMQVTVTRETDRTEKYMTFLASTGSTAPFIGLFGTVWGIMNSFQAIAMTRNTSLAVVAPGIAEALFATALGLVAAIPAVVAYNKLSRELDRYTSRLDSFAGEFSAILSRQMEERE
ncbi:protein TolQ [Magnetospira sp. QH-2]|uniref:protein TolQ n=1 Tax=Magnetospira sp. (strain QH-2) TaxID=1288970 RepID=UPI0003E80DEF|nr:protein TolQ [Magnetospira sp. QH-2]CCQ73314.1 MotA/TolQ/ExbB proton channel, biopolymer transport protein [Magnetospira sp. QH-2]